MFKFIREDGTEIPMPRGMKAFLGLVGLLALALAVLTFIGVGALIATATA